MAGKFIELNDAAKQLGITAQRLLEMRDAGEAHGYRDGASWKFKVAEIERIAGELSAIDAANDADLSFSDSGALSGDDFDSLLDVNVDLDSDAIDAADGSSILINDEESEDESSITAIGKEKPTAKGSDQRDLKLADVDNASDEISADDQLAMVADAELRLADDAGLDSELDLSEDLHFESDDSLSLGEDSNVATADTPASGLASPSDSGLSLEPKSDGDSSIESLELPEDSDMLSIEDGLASAPDDSTQLQQDEEFILSPSGEMFGDESSDSGSQVIALDDSEAFSDSAELGEPADAEPISLVEDAEISDGPLEPFDGAELTPMAVATGSSGLPEASFSVWNVLSLLLVVMMLSVIGMLMTDVIRNMWTWNSDIAGAGGLADSIVSMLGMN